MQNPVISKQINHKLQIFLPPQGKLYEEQLNLIEKSIDEGEYAASEYLFKSFAGVRCISIYLRESFRCIYNLSRFDDAERSLLQSIALGGSSLQTLL